MADQDIELDEAMFEDLYADEPEPEPTKNESAKPQVAEPAPAAEPEAPENFKAEDADDFNIKTEPNQDSGVGHSTQNGGGDYEKPIGMKDDGKMFIGGLNWETTDQSLKDYFSQFGEVIDCQVMRDGATGRSRGFGFLTFKDPKTVNSVMVKEHSLDGKLIDPKRAIPREEQERTAKIFVGGVSQECTDSEFREFFEQFGRVLDATLMMDKETGRPRGFGFVTFDSDAAVDRTLAQDLSIHDKWIEVKRAEPRGNMRDGDGAGHGKFGRPNRGQNFNQDNQQNQAGQNQQGNTMSMAQAATYWQMMQNMFKQSQMMANANGGGMNPMAAMQMQQQMMAARGMNPAMMQQMGGMQNMQANMGNMQGNMGNMGNINQGYPGMQSPGSGSPINGGAGQRPAFNAQEQLLFEQQKYERQQNVRTQSGSFQGSNTWDGMYDDVPPPSNIQGGNNRAGIGHRGRGGRPGSQGATPQPAIQAPANAPTGPRNANVPGANYRGGGRGGRRGYHPYARGGV